MIENKTNLQKNILRVCKGYTLAEVIISFEVIKMDLLIKEWKEKWK